MISPVFLWLDFLLRKTDMHPNQSQTRRRWIHWISLLSVFLVIVGSGIPLSAQDRTAEIAGKLNGFDAFVEKVMTDWNAPGMGVGIVVNDQLVFAKGYGYRDFEKKLPFTTSTLSPIGSNTKLFTAIAAGMLVTEGKLSWDQPIRENAPWLRFNTSELNNSVTLRDMLAHRTGLSRTDFAWYQSDFTSQELTDLIRYIEPKAGLRQTFSYNNFMYVAAGQIIESQSGQPWESFVRSRILAPLKMNRTTFAVADLERDPDHAIPVMETRDDGKLYRLPFYQELRGTAPAGAIQSNVTDLSHWVIALLNDGMYQGQQVLPASVLKATLEPAIVCQNKDLENGFSEVLNPTYGMGRWIASYRGHRLTYHGGSIDGYISQISMMPQEKIGVILLFSGEHIWGLHEVVSYQIYDRLLELNATPWNERRLATRLKEAQAEKDARSKVDKDKVPGTKPSHALADYVGEYEHPVYGILKIGLKDGQLHLESHKLQFPLIHFHYDRFDTPDDEYYGRWSINFSTNLKGVIEKAGMTMNDSEWVFTRRSNR